jgi:hypothetical protein
VVYLIYYGKKQPPIAIILLYIGILFPKLDRDLK